MYSKKFTIDFSIGLFTAVKCVNLYVKKLWSSFCKFAFLFTSK